MKDKPFFSAQVKVTRIFCQCWMKLTPKQQELVRKKIALLVKNYRHSSLKTHPIHRCPGKWECSLSKTNRLVYSRCKGLYVLHAVGGHDVIDNAHSHYLDASDLECELEDNEACGL